MRVQRVREVAPYLHPQAVMWTRVAAYASEDRSALFDELVRFYAHFGLAREECAELPDHLGVELEFMHFSCWLEHGASARGDDLGGSGVRSAIS
jgi:nitrate reductase assembly molybdenum cofactor insertion protein NarJ